MRLGPQAGIQITMQNKIIIYVHWLASALAVVFALAGIVILFTATPLVALIDFAIAAVCFAVRRGIRRLWPEFDWPPLQGDADIQGIATELFERHGAFSRHFARLHVKEAIAANDPARQAVELRVQKQVNALVAQSHAHVFRPWYANLLDALGEVAYRLRLRRPPDSPEMIGR